MAMFTGALLLGAAHLRAGALPRAVAVAVVSFGALTLPLGLVLPALLGGVVPEYVCFEAHFLFSGAMWTVVGLGARGPVSLPPAGPAGPPQAGPDRPRPTRRAAPSPSHR